MRAAEIFGPLGERYRDANNGYSFQHLKVKVISNEIPQQGLLPRIYFKLFLVGLEGRYLIHQIHFTHILE